MCNKQFVAFMFKPLIGNGTDLAVLPINKPVAL